ncbi:KR-domain-containing protein [Xylaria longipes]|nr:KR-domain-containing protein [Xylaria longipes]
MVPYQDASSDLKKFIRATQHLSGLYERRLPSNEMSGAEIEKVLSACQGDKPSWSIFPVTARSLRDILLGSTNAPELVFSAGLAEPLYRDTFDPVCDQRLHRFLALASHENPGMRILEIGAGAGSMTRHILGNLCGIETLKGTTVFKEYTYTDMSPSFFDKTRDEFGEERVSFQAFDVETDATQQGIQRGSYDLVVAGSVLYATRSLTTTLRNVYKLLAPGGKLIFLELTCPDNICANVGFGLLLGWWLSQEEYCDQVLKRSGFSGTDLALRDHPSDSCHISSIMTSTALRSSSSHPPHQTKNVALILDNTIASQVQLASSLKQVFGTSHAVDIHDLDSSSLVVSDVAIALFEVGAFLANLSAQDFERVQKLLQVAQRLVWVSSGLQVEGSYPYYHLATGLLRVIRSEAPEKRIVLLVEETRTQLDLQTLTRSILEVLDAYVYGDHPEVELVIRDGLLCSGRIVEDIGLDERISAMIHQKRSFSRLDDDPPLKLDIGTPGMLVSLRLVEDLEADQPLGTDDAEIQIKAWGVNFRDLFLALGRLEGEKLGWDCVGVVTRSGPGCEFKPGDRVELGVPGSMRTCITAASRNMFRIPESATFEEAVLFGIPACTAYYCLVDVARLYKNEKVFIYSAAGSTGQMAIWIAKHCGAEIFATVGNEKKKQLFIEKFGILPAYIFYSGDVGVDVVLNSLSGDRLAASWNCMAPFGRFVEIGKADISANSFFAVDLYYVGLINPDLMSKKYGKVLSLLDSDSGNNIGRIIITLDVEDVVPKYLIERPQWMLDPDASYVIVGGLGGIGRATAKWMAGKGARHLILPSRSGPTFQASLQVVQELKDAGINPSMLKQDSMFELMSFAQWDLTVRLKVNTLWNLHELLPHNLDFFVLLSLVAGIYGSITQANYAAGCTFQDALARYMVSRGRNAVSLDVGWMRTIGIIAERDDYTANREKTWRGEHHAIDGRNQVLNGATTPAMFLSRGEEPAPQVRGRMFSGFYPSQAVTPNNVRDADNDDDSKKHAEAFRQARDPRSRSDAVKRAVAAKLARVLSIAAGEVDTEKTLSDYGVDSLMAVELHTWFGNDFGAKVAVFDFMGNHKTIEAVAEMIVDRSELHRGVE